MSKKSNISTDQALCLKKIEDTIGESIPEVEEVEWDTFGVKIENGEIVGLGLYSKGLKTLPESILDLHTLKVLQLEENRLTEIPPSVIHLRSLQHLNLNKNELYSFNEFLTELNSLQILSLANNQIKTLPESIDNLTSLQVLDLGYNKISLLPNSITNLSSIKELYFAGNRLTTLPEANRTLNSLTILDIESNMIENLPDTIDHYQGLERLLLGDNQLSSLPESIGKIVSLEKIDLNRNKLTDFPSSFINLKYLKTLDIGYNKFSALQESIGNLSSLKELWLGNNQLQSLPGSLWQLKELELLELRGNSWKDDWIDIASRDVPTVLELCRQRATIKVFISHVEREYKKYQIEDLAKFLEAQIEIYPKVFYSERYMVGDMEASMEKNIEESQILLFIASHDSVYESEPCKFELEIAQKHSLEIIPLKGDDISWEELEREGLASIKGLNIDLENFRVFCQELYEYIVQYKREINLFEKVEAIVDKVSIKMKSSIDDFLSSSKGKGLIKTYLPQLNDLLQKLKNDQISPLEFFDKCASVLSSSDKIK